MGKHTRHNNRKPLLPCLSWRSLSLYFLPSFCLQKEFLFRQEGLVTLEACVIEHGNFFTKGQSVVQHADFSVVPVLVIEGRGVRESKSGGR